MMQYLTKALLAACWFMLLTFPVMGIKLNSVDQTVEWQFDRVILLGVAIFFPFHALELVFQPQGPRHPADPPA